MSEGLILVADDSQDIRQVIEETILVPAGYAVRSVGDGMSALSLARELSPVVVIADQNMPNLTGLELTRRLHKDRPDIPVILMTSEGSQRLVVEAMRAGAVDFLSKPFETEHLLAAVGRAIQEGFRWKSMVEAETKVELSQTNLERRIHELETLTSVGRSVTAMLNIDEVLAAVVDSAVRLTEAEEGSLLLLDETTGDLYMRASKNFDEKFARTFRLQVQDSLAGQVVESGEPVLLDQNSPQKIKTSYLVHSLIYTPLLVRGHTIGVLGVDNRGADRRLFTEDDLRIMGAMADYAAIAIENAQLFQQSESERLKLETILTQTENAVIVIDLEGRILLVNSSARRIFSLPDETEGRLAKEVFRNPKLSALIQSESTIAMREEIELDDGRYFNAVRTPIEGVGQAVVMHDISHLRELDRIKSDFVTTVSHDLRSPLTAILGYVDLIERTGEINDQQQEFIERVRLSVEQITSLVSDLLDLGRIEAGLDDAKEPTPIAVLARYVLDSMRAAAEAKSITLKSELPESLPLIVGDPIRLRQMLGNLLENAIKYTPHDGEVMIEAHAENDQVILCVSDSGFGIPTADQPYLFDKFFRASNVPENLPGTGLGLSIVKSIVENHQGRIWVDSVVGEGTAFTIVFPAAPV
jgi:signal transduction histidine kinase/FixJ family two-component response regulator